MIKSFKILTAGMAIILWAATIAVIAIAISKHQFWNLTPIIAHNWPQNYLGWMVTAAFICSIASPILKLIDENSSKND